MANVQPQSFKKALNREYKFRFFGFLFCALALSTLIGTLLLVPSYLLSRSRVQANSDRIELLGTYRAANEADIHAVTLERLKRQIALYSEERAVVVSDLFEAVVEERGGNVVVGSLSWEEGGGENMVGELFVGGEAASRDALLAFVSRLEGRDEFSQVDFPIENLANRADVSFALTLTVLEQ